MYFYVYSTFIIVNNIFDLIPGRRRAKLYQTKENQHLKTLNAIQCHRLEPMMDFLIKHSYWASLGDILRFKSQIPEPVSLLTL